VQKPVWQPDHANSFVGKCGSNFPLFRRVLLSGWRIIGDVLDNRSFVDIGTMSIDNGYLLPCATDRIFPITYVFTRHAYVILPYVNRTLTSLYDENKLSVGLNYLQPCSHKSPLNVSLILANANNKNN